MQVAIAAWLARAAVLARRHSQHPAQIPCSGPEIPCARPRNSLLEHGRLAENPRISWPAAAPARKKTAKFPVSREFAAVSHRRSAGRFQRLDPRQLAAFEPFEKGAAGGR